MSKRAAKNRNHDVAIIGMAGKFPGAENLDQFWNNLREGKDSITFFSEEELRKAGVPEEWLALPQYVRAKGIVPGHDAFDADFFAYPPRDAARMDPQIRLLHESAWHALEDAGYNPETYSGQIGAYLGINDNLDWIERIISSGASYGENFDHFLLNYRDYAATRVSFSLNLRGPSFTLLSACSTSLLAVHLACQALRTGDCTIALAGGASIMFPEVSGYIYQEGLMLSSDGKCRPFDANADGTVFGDGVGVVVLKLLTQARKDGDNILAVVRGSAINNDGSDKLGFTTPSVAGQCEVIRSAHKAAGVSPTQISFLETHGTGTKAGDPVEFEALRRAFGGNQHGYCTLGSVKANIGHVNVAAGVAALMKTVLALRHKSIPPHPYFSAPNPAIDLARSPFTINTKLKPWKKRNGKRIAGVSAFGFGGTNAHCIVEEAPVAVNRKNTQSLSILPVSGKTPEALQANAAVLAEWLESHPAANLSDVAFTLTFGRKHFPFRQTVATSDSRDAVIQLRKLWTNPHPAAPLPVAFMFPGQGSQFPGMGTDLYLKEPVFRRAVQLCGRRLKELIGLDILRYIGPGSIDRTKEELSETKIAQPVIFVYSYALTQLFIHWGIRPTAVIGHSMGEIVAACIAGILSLDDALYLIARRGELLDTMERGSMLAVQIEEDKLAGYLDSELSLAAVNAPSMAVVSGRSKKVKLLQTLLRNEGIPSQVLATSHAFHSHLMEPVLSEFSRIGIHLQYNAPAIRMMSTVTASWVGEPDGAVIDTTYWSRNIRQTVRFSDAVRRLIGEHNGILLEVGPGSTLVNLVKMQRAVLNGHPLMASVDIGKRNADEISSVYETVGKLWEHGVEIDWTKLKGSTRPHRISLPPYQFQRQHFEPPVSRQGAAIPAATGSWSRLHKVADNAEWYYVPSWKRTPLPFFCRDVDAEPQCWLVLSDEHGLGAGISRALRNADQDVIEVVAGPHKMGEPEMCDGQQFTVDPNRHDHLLWLFERLQESGKTPSRIIHCWTVTPPESDSISESDASAFQNRAFFSLLHLAQVIGSHAFGREMHITVVTNHMHDVIGWERVIADKATVLGPVKVIPQEYPDIRCCAVDIGTQALDDASMIDTVLSEAVTNVLEPVVAYRGGHRWVQSFERVRLEQSLETRSWIRQHGTYLITGGLGGLGLAFAEFLSRETQANLILTSRTGLPPENEWESWLAEHVPGDATSAKILSVQSMRSAGATVRVFAADVIDHGAMKSMIDSVRSEFGAIDGVIHAAGIPGDGIIQLKKDDLARDILAPKIQGTMILDQLLAEQPPSWILLCSSVASFLGGIGLVDYCSANAFLDTFVARANARGTSRWVSINWDMWGEAGMGLKTAMPEELRQWLDKELRDGLTSAEGVAALDRVMSWNKSSNVIVSTRDLQARIDLWVRREFIKTKESLLDEEESTQARYTRPALGPTYEAPRNEIEESIAAAWRKLFSVEPIGRTDNYFELGGHSLLATTLVSRLKKEFNTSLSIRDILDHPILADLAEYIAVKREGVVSAPGTPGSDPELEHV